MLYAQAPDASKVQATKGAEAICPLCGSAVIPKCGEVMRWHWAHSAHPECDPWWEESEWHLGWKALAPLERTEVSFRMSGLLRRADVITPQGHVLELQHSPMPPSEIRLRESFYAIHANRPLMWLIDATDADGRISVWPAPAFTLGGVAMGYKALRWSRPRVFFLHARRPKFIDLGEAGIFDLRRANREDDPIGWGFLLSREHFIARYITGAL